MNVAIALSIKRIDRDLKFVPKLIILLITAPFFLVSGCGFQSLQHEPDTIYSAVNIQASQVNYTGLVIDARGKGVIPSMRQQILVRVDSAYQIVYGSGVYNVEAVRWYGPCGYKKTLNEAYLDKERIGTEPLTIRPVQAVGPKNIAVVVSREDADLIISAFKATGFEKECKVIFVID